ncbi:MAG: LysR substrate-binding domain-containing protein [Sphingobium sp.]
MSDARLLPSLAVLRAFEAVGRLGGIRRAAKELSIDHAVISRHIRSLESWVGVGLLVRQGVRHTLTAEGEAYYEEIHEALTRIANATGKLIKGNGELKLRVWCIPGFASLWLSRHLGDFIASNPDIIVDFRPADSGPDFRSREVDCDIRYLRRWEEEALPRSVQRLELARPAVFPVATADCLARLPPITSAEDLLKCPLLHEDNDLEWVNWFRLQEIEPSPQPLPGSRLWHAHLTINAALQGHGIALANHMLLGDNLHAGHLQVVQPQGPQFVPVQFGGYTFMAREDQWSAPAIVRFRRWLQRTASIQ